jgi:hypothetical protein
MLTVNFDVKRLREIYNNVLIFFEIINKENVPICWAFLKFFSPSSINIDKKFKLQLFRYRTMSASCFRSIFAKRTEQVNLQIFDQWQMDRKKFPSVLNVYLKDMNFLASTSEKREVTAKYVEQKTQPLWRKIPGQACKIPNKLLHKIPSRDKGSMAVKFSCDGSLIAFTEISKDGFFLHVFKFPEMQNLFTMLEHSNFIHDIDFLRQKHYNSHRMVTASSDFTAIVWKIDHSSYTYTILPHPAFVYASKFLQQKDDSDSIRVVTAGRDSIIRIWQSRKDMQSFELTQELRHPHVNKFTYITQIASRNADTFYTSSSTGDVVEWTLRNTRDYHMNRHFELDEMRGKVINCMDLNPRGNKICVRVQDASSVENSNSIFILGVPTGTVTQRFQQISTDPQAQGKVKISPCGTQIFATDGSVIRFYQLVNGNLVSSVDRNILNVKLSLSEKSIVSAMDYHPKDFYLVISVYGKHGGVFVTAYESNETDPIEKLKASSGEKLQHKQLIDVKHGTRFDEIIRRLDDAFLAPDNDNMTHANNNNNISNRFEENTFTVKSDSKRSRTYTVSHGPATFTVQKGQNNTYEIQKNEQSDDDDTTISESFN